MAEIMAHVEYDGAESVGVSCFAQRPWHNRSDVSASECQQYNLLNTKYSQLVEMWNQIYPYEAHSSKTAMRNVSR